MKNVLLYDPTTGDITGAMSISSRPEAEEKWMAAIPNCVEIDVPPVMSQFKDAKVDLTTKTLINGPTAPITSTASSAITVPVSLPAPIATTPITPIATQPITTS